MRHVGIGEALGQTPSGEALLRVHLSVLEGCGHRVEVFAGPRINLPMRDPKLRARSPVASTLIKDVRRLQPAGGCVNADVIATGVYEAGICRKSRLDRPA